VVEQTIRAARAAFLKMRCLSGEQKNAALSAFADLLASDGDYWLAENRKDLQEQKGLVPDSIYHRLELDRDKLSQLISGVRALIALDEPCDRTLWRRKLDDGLILEKKTVPIGVIGVIFEARPDAVAQILSLFLKSGNAAVLKGGKEARHSNAAMREILLKLAQRCPFLPDGWAGFLTTQDEARQMLAYDQWIDLVIPRGSNQLVRSVMATTSIPVLGHADGICHVYVESSADLEKSLAVVIDAKTQYPAACNAVECVLIDQAVADVFLQALQPEARRHGLQLLGCEKVRRILPLTEPVTDWSTEYGDLLLALKIVDGCDEAVAHINRFGSHHTDAVMSANAEVRAKFLNEVDSANVFVNVSTRFADGYRYGMGAEVGVSTSKLHARGPVGIDGLLTYKYCLSGDGHIVADYSGASARSFRHEDF